MQDLQTLLEMNIGVAAVICGVAVAILLAALIGLGYALRWRQKAKENGHKCSGADCGFARAVVRGSLEGIVIVDEKAIVQTVNPAAEQMLGFREEEVRGRALFYLFPALAPDRDSGRELTSLFWAPDHPGAIFNVAGRRREGSLVPVRMRASRAGEGAQAGLVLTFRPDESDPPQRRQPLRQLDQAQILAMRVSTFLDHLLTTIRGYSDLLLNDPGIHSTPNEDAAEIKRACELGLNFSAKLRRFGKRAAEPSEARDLCMVLKDWEKKTRTRLANGVILETDISPGLPSISLAPADLEEVLDQFAENAIEAMPRGGRLTVKTYRAREADGDVVVLEISDTGCGLEEETKSRILEPFFTTKPQWRALGLGITTAAIQLSRYQGKISVGREQGIGATFRITLPLSVEAAPSTLEEAPKPQKEAAQHHA